MQPAPDRLLPAHGGGPADEDEERGLEGVLGVVLVAQDRAADAEDHRPVPLDQGREGRPGRLVPVPVPVRTAGEPAQQLAVGQPARRARVEERPDVLEYSSARDASIPCRSPDGLRVKRPVVPRRPLAVPTFSEMAENPRKGAVLSASAWPSSSPPPWPSGCCGGSGHPETSPPG